VRSLLQFRCKGGADDADGGAGIEQPANFALGDRAAADDHGVATTHIE